MPKTTPWREIRAKRPVSEEAVRRETLIIKLAVLRDRYGLTQTEVAEMLGTTQSNVSQLESNDDLRLSTIARYVHALNGQLELKAVFGDEEYTLLRDVSEVPEVTV